MYPQIEDGIYQLSDYQKERVDNARKEWLNGQLISNEDLFLEIEKWLNEEEQTAQ